MFRISRMKLVASIRHALTRSRLPRTQAGWPPSAASLPHPPPPTLHDLEWGIRRHILDCWFPRALDETDCGFHQSFGPEWESIPDDSRSLVYQARLTWVCARAARRYPHEAALWLSRARRGFELLSGPLRDREGGGWYWQLGFPSLLPNTDRGAEKHAYGMAFGIYAAAEFFAASGSEQALILAQEAFEWLDRCAHDADFGGYFEALSREGRPLWKPPGARPRTPLGSRYGDKSMNGHLHLLEAFTALYAVWPDPCVRARLEELVSLVIRRLAAPSGYLRQEFRPHWRPRGGPDSFGHDVEAAYLLWEASRSLGEDQGPSIGAFGRALVDHALRFGWDGNNGGFFDSGHPDGRITRAEKVWWVQAEALQALGLLERLFGAEDARYGQALCHQWQFICRHQLDDRHAGWHTEVSAAGQAPAGQRKSHAWKDPYHQARALWGTIDRLSDRV